MTVATENSIRALPLNSEEVIFGELSLTKCALEILFESDEAQIPKEELLNDVLKIVEMSERIREAETPRQKFDVYYFEYRQLSNELKAKYSEFLTRETFREIENHGKYLDGLRDLIVAQGIMLIAFEEETDKVRQYGILYTGMVRLSELAEEYLPYFSQGLIEYIEGIALAFLNDTSFKTDRNNQKESVFSYLVGLKNAAKALLWQIQERQIAESERLRLTSSLSTNPILTRETQIQKNQAAMEWAKSRLNQIENTRKTKG